MASEMRRIARALVERHEETFASRYSRDESGARLRKALEGFAPTRTRFDTTWRQEDGALHLDVAFAPASRISRFLKAASLALSLLLAAAFWALFAAGDEPVMRFLVSLTCVLGILGFPFVAVALGSQREAEEATLRRAIRRALVDEERR
jgi:hypothetical protein